MRSAAYRRDAQRPDDGHKLLVAVLGYGMASLDRYTPSGQKVYIYRDWPFHIPGQLLATYGRHPGVVRLGGKPHSALSRFIRRGQLTFEDGFVVYHGIVWI